VIFPSTSSCANFRRWALLLNGIQGFYRPPASAARARTSTSMPSRMRSRPN
jgi:hypothetical protein